MHRFIPYNPKLKELARKLRKNMTSGEVLLWNKLKEDKLFGFDFDRQRCIDNYIVDFYCKEIMLAIEVDGAAHNGEEAFVKDSLRQKKLEDLGVTFLRFTESKIKHDIVNVIRVIEGTMIDLIKTDKSIKLPINFDKSFFD